jgi:hypothetical protein
VLWVAGDDHCSTVAATAEACLGVESKPALLLADTVTLVTVGRQERLNLVVIEFLARFGLGTVEMLRAINQGD